MKTIFLEKADKSHPVLDYDKCVEIYDSARQKLGGETIGSPFDIYSVETIRKRLGFDGHPAIATNVFVWGEGEPQKPFLTKIGGLPYLPQGTDWPRDANGQPYIFVAQICFVDSRDVVPIPVPGDVLLMFAKQGGWHGEYLECYEPDHLYFKWVRIEDQPMWDHESMMKNDFRSVELTFFGVLHRTRDYDPSEEMESKIDLDYRIPFVEGTKIGGYPCFIQNGPPDFIENGPVDNIDRTYHDVKLALTWDDATYIGQFASLQFASEEPFPWCNREKPIGHEFGTGDSIYAKGKSLMIGDMGSIYLYLKPDGTIAWFEECY